MESTILVVIIMLVARGEAKEDMENIVKEMQMQMNVGFERCVLTEEKLLELKTENVQLKERMKITEEALINTKEDLANTKEDLLTKDQELEMDVSFLKEPPFFHACGYKDYTYITGQTIPYSSLLYSSTNTEGGDLDISTGIFSSPYPGSYTVTWSLEAVDDAGDSAVVIYLRKNGQKIDESRTYSYYTGSSGRVSDQGKNITQYYNTT
jgi:hypothetical protein